MKNKTFPIRTYLLTLLLIPFAITAKDIGHTQILIGGDHNHSSYEFINEQGQPNNHNTELTHAIAEIMGINIEIQLGTWDSMRNRLKQGEYRCASRHDLL